MSKREPWQWPRTDEAREKRERRARTIATGWGESLLDILRIPAELLPGAGSALDRAGSLIARHAADMRISALDGPSAMVPLDGVPPPVTAKEGDGPVYIEGVEVNFTVEHNGRGRAPILLEWVEFCLDRFVAGRDPYFSFERSGEELIGAGFVEPWRFFVEVGGSGAKPARRQINGPDGKRQMVVARGPNALNTDPGSAFAFKPGDEPQILKFILTAIDAGSYEIRVRFLYRVEGDLREYLSETIRIYSDGGGE